MDLEVNLGQNEKIEIIPRKKFENDHFYFFYRGRLGNYFNFILTKKQIKELIDVLNKALEVK